MITIHKWTLQIKLNVLAIPIGAQFLTVQMQNGNPQLWAKVDTDQEDELRHVVFVGTGHVIPGPATNLRYISTVQMDGGSLVFHAFEIMKSSDRSEAGNG